MSMTELRESIREAADEEKIRADIAHSYYYHSPHEAWAILKEEIEEACEAARGMEIAFDKGGIAMCPWMLVRNWTPDGRHGKDLEESICSVMSWAEQSACEMVQVAAVCRRFLESIRDGGTEWNAGKIKEDENHA